VNARIARCSQRENRRSRHHGNNAQRSCLGCGSQHKSGVEGYQDRATSLCKAEQKELDSIGTPKSVADLSDWLSKVSPILEKRIEDLQQMDPPPAFEGGHERIIDLNKQGLRIITAAATKLDQGADPTIVVDDLNDLEALDATESRIWSDLGVEECAAGFVK
jgi:hypothetical protein